MSKKDLTARVYQEVRSRILNFRYHPGFKFSDEEIATEIGSSRTPVREALNRLAEQGLVDARPNKGFWVKTFSKKEVEDLYVLRDALEGLAISLTIKNLDAKKSEALKKLLESYPKLMEGRELSRLNDADEKFHDLIALYSGNSALYDTLKNLSGKIRIIRRYDHLRPTSFKETYEEHWQVLNHMLNGELSRAKKSMSKHIIGSMKTVLKVLPQ
jgi:DNA-binding GntR family transcriptional regulator